MSAAPYLQFTAEQLDRARTRWDIITADVPMRRQGRELAGLCQFHIEKSPSFYIVPDKGMFHCFGCGAHGTVVEYVMRTRNLDFVDAVRFILDLPPQRARDAAPLARHTDRDDTDHAAEIAEILAGCGPVERGTAARLYLMMRGLNPVQPALYAHPALPCWELGRDEHGDVRTLPALVAPFTDSKGRVTALQRIWLLDRIEFADGSGPQDNRAPLRTRKKSIGVIGDGAVRLTPLERVGTTLGQAEGVETGDAAKRIYRVPTWAAGGTARFGFPAHWRAAHTPQGERPTIWIPPDRPPRGVEAIEVAERPPTIWLPDHVERVIVFGDRGATGEAVARHAAAFWARQGRDSEAVFPSDPRFDDFNTELLGSAA